MRKTVISLYQDVASARAAMQNLLDDGFDRNDVSLLVNQIARGNDPLKQSKSRYWRRGSVDAPMGVLLGLIAGIAIGALAGALFAALPLTYPLATLAAYGAAIGGATGAVAGGILNSSVPRILGQNLATVDKAGASLVQVRAADADLARARNILSQHRPVAMEDRRSAWYQRGWEAYDPAAEPVR